MGGLLILLVVDVLWVGSAGITRVGEGCSMTWWRRGEMKSRDELPFPCSLALELASALTWGHNVCWYSQYS